MGLSGNILVKSNITKSKFDNFFDIRKEYCLRIQNMRKIHLLGFSIQRLWGKSLETSRNFSMGPLFSKFDWWMPITFIMENVRREDEVGKGLNLAHLNVRSLLGGHKFDMLRNQIENSNIDVFSISESWLNGAVPDRVVECMGYDMIRLDRDWSERDADNALPKRGGGLVCFIKEGLKYSDTSYAVLNKSCKDLEMLWVKLEINNMRPVVVVIVYRPPQGDYKKCLDYIDEAFERANLKDNTDIFLMGDFNIDFSDRQGNKTKELEFMTRSLGLEQKIKGFTRSALRNGTLSESKLDLIFTNSEYIMDARSLDYNISDHLAVMVTRKKQPALRQNVDFSGRSYRHYDKIMFKQNLAGLNWANFYESNNPNELWDIMEGHIVRQANMQCPIRKFRVKAQREPWLTNEALEAIKDKDRLLKKAKRSRKVQDWEAARRARNQVGRELENLRAEFLKREQQAFAGDPKKFWANISSIFPGKKGKTSKIWLKDLDNNEEVKSEQTANFINSYFTNIGPNLAKKLDREWEYFGITAHEKIGDMATNLDEVNKLCKDINTMKSSGIDVLSSRLCKDAFMVLGNQLVHMFNCSLMTGNFPAKWKVAKIIPLFKGGDRENVNNYRPVSLLPMPGKLLEKIVHNRIVEF